MAKATAFAAIAAAALVVVVFSAADQNDSLLLQQQKAGVGGYALPPGYADSSGAESRDHSRWWEHAAPSPQRKPAAPTAQPTRVKPHLAALPASMLEAMDTSGAACCRVLPCATL